MTSCAPRILALAFLLTLGPTCNSASSKGGGTMAATSAEKTSSTITFFTSLGEVPVQVEVADEPHELSRGLMFRESLHPNSGMLFVFPEVDEHPFWMKNTYISLDMIFLDAQTKVVGVVANATPMSTATLGVKAPSKYVVEVTAGYAKDHAIEPGVSARIEIRPSAADEPSAAD